MSRKTEELVSAGLAFMNAGKHKQAEEKWRQATEIDPECAAAWTYLTECLSLTKRTLEAGECLDRLIDVADRSAESLYKLADKCAFLSRYSQARKFLFSALEANPAKEIWLNARLLQIKIDFAENEWLDAVRGATEILAVDPKNTEALLIRQRSYFCLGWTEEDIADCRTYLDLQPDAERHHRLLFKLNCLRTSTPESLYEESLRWNELYATPLSARIKAHKNIPDPDRKLRIGYVSPDFRHHAIMRLLPGVLENHDRKQFEIFAYSIDTQRDQATAQAERSVDHFVELPSSCDEVAERVRQDAIDILIDLAGRTMPVNALLAFALKPAPVQATWMGTLATTGMPMMDYFIGDAYMPSPGTEHLFSEKVYRLPRVHACYRSLGEVDLVTPPYFKNGYITFGSFNDPKKIDREVIKVWSVILHFIPGSKLLMKSTNLQHEIVQRRFRDWFRENGIADERVKFEGPGGPLDFLASINEIDIALDPFPYTGGTTTLETLWMGAPVVSVAGRTAVARCSVCLLATVGLAVANTLEQYVALALAMAQAVPFQPDSRKQLRERFAKSQLRDEVGMARAIEGAYRDMWRTWCARSQAASY